MSAEKRVSVKMTQEQLEAIQPLLEHAREQWGYGRQGIILCQPFGLDQDHKDAGMLRFGFIEHERAKILQDIVALPVVKR